MVYICWQIIDSIFVYTVLNFMKSKGVFPENNVTDNVACYCTESFEHDASLLSY